MSSVRAKTFPAGVLLMLTMVGLASIRTEARSDAVKVYVTSDAEGSGFTDPSKDTRDTVKDLRSALEDQHNIHLVDSQADATIVLTVLGRKTAQMTAGFFGPARDRMIRVKFTCGDYETEMSASAQGGTLGSGGAWHKAAKKIAKQVSDWVTANREKLVKQ